MRGKNPLFSGSEYSLPVGPLIQPVGHLLPFARGEGTWKTLPLKVPQSAPRISVEQLSQLFLGEVQLTPSRARLRCDITKFVAGFVKIRIGAIPQLFKHSCTSFFVERLAEGVGFLVICRTPTPSR